MNTPHSYNSHYHIDIVPTIYVGNFFSTETYQYTYNHNTFEVNHMPALYFNYHIGGTRVVVATWKGAFPTFLLNMCAVIGGIYALAHFMYNTLFAVFGTKIGYQELGQWWFLYKLDIGYWIRMMIGHMYVHYHSFCFFEVESYSS